MMRSRGSVGIQSTPKISLSKVFLVRMREDNIIGRVGYDLSAVGLDAQNC